MDVSEIEEEIKRIKERNIRVEADKAWETSLTRKVFVAALTYLVVASFLIVLGIERPWLNALIPSIAFLLSTLSIAVVKNGWIKKFREK